MSSSDYRNTTWSEGVCSRVIDIGWCSLSWCFAVASKVITEEIRDAGSIDREDIFIMIANFFIISWGACPASSGIVVESVF